MNKIYINYFQSLLFTFLIACSLNDSKAQTTVQIGSGTETPSATLYSPVYRSSASSSIGYVRSDILFTQAELSAAGIHAGDVISSLQFNKVNEANFLIPANLGIYMGNTTRTSFPASSPWLTWAEILSTHAQVYNNTAFNLPYTAGWVTFNVTPFTYTGGSLEIATDLAMQSGTTGATGPFQWEYTAGIPSNLICAGTAGTFGPSNLNATTAANKYRPNIKITFTGSTMPVKLTRISANKVSGDVLLSWETASEANFSHYEIERSADAYHFAKAGIVNAQPQFGNNKTYSFTDVNVLNATSLVNGSLYYRLKMVDKDGRFEYSKIVSVKPSIEMTEVVTTYPNPFTDAVYIKMNLLKTSKVILTITDAAGRVIRSKKLTLAQGESIVSFLQLDNLQMGTFILSASVNGKISTVKIMR